MAELSKIVQPALSELERLTAAMPVTDRRRLRSRLDAIERVLRELGSVPRTYEMN